MTHLISWKAFRGFYDGGHYSLRRDIIHSDKIIAPNGTLPCIFEATPTNRTVALAQHSAMYMCERNETARARVSRMLLEYVCVQVSCIQRTRKKCVLAKQLIGLSILHINQQDRQLNMTILNYTLTLQYITYIPIHYIVKF